MKLFAQKMLLFTLVFTVAGAFGEGWECPAKGDKTYIWKALDSLKQMRYPNGPYITALGESSVGLGQAMEAARLELTKKISGEITFRLQSVKKGAFAEEASELVQTAHFDQVSLLHSDEDLVCNAGSSWVAEAHLRLQDYADILKRAYQDSASSFRVNAQQALKAKDVKSFTTSWQRAKRLQPLVATQGLYLTALLADASRGMSVDLTQVLDKTPFPPFFEDMKLWESVGAERENRLRAASIGVNASPGAQGYSADVANLLSSKGIVLTGTGASFHLNLDGSESGFESAYGSIWTCNVQGSADLIGPGKKSLGKVKLRDETWKDYASGDSTEACTKAWRKMGESEELGELLIPLFGSIVPLD